MMDFAQRLGQLQKIGTITILAVSKGQSPKKIQEAILAGQHSFGENYVDEAIGKIRLFPKEDWHFIGTIQSNKIALLVEYFSCIETVCREKEIHLLEKEAAKQKKIVKILLQYDPGVEETKHGATERQILELAELALKQPNLQLCGLMTMAPNVDVEQRRAYFKKAKLLFDQMVLLTKNCTVLSMGMSDDYIVAIEEGATQIRLGTLLFGQRS